MAFVRPQRVQFQAAFRTLQWDVSKEETHTSTAKITEHPVEDGSVISDHVVEEQDRLDLELIQSNTPIISQNEARANADVLPFRAEDLYNQLVDMKRQHVAIDVVTSLRVYTNMIIEKIVVNRNAQKGRILAASISLKQIITATSLTVAAPTPRDIRAVKKTDQGKKPTTPATPGVQTRTTIGLKVFDFSGVGE